MSSQGIAIVHYEVYALDGQRWTLHARFRKDEKEDALEEAKIVENSLGFCAKVVRETYYPGNNASEEMLVYSSDKNFRPRVHATAPRRAYARGDAGFNAAIATPDFRTAGKAKAAGSMGVLLKLLLVVAAALAIAGGVTAIVSNLITKLDGAISGNASSLLVFLTFVITFLISGVPMALSVVDWRESSSVKDTKPKYRPQAPMKDVTAPIDDTPPPPVDVQPEAAGEPEAEKQAAEEKKDEDGEAAPEQVAAPEKPAEPESETPADEKSGGPDEQAPEPMESFRMAMIRLLSGLLTEIKKIRPNLDAYNIFGIDLMLAGAIDVLGTQKHLEPEDKRAILKDTIEVMGTKSEVAKAFADKYEDYLVEPKYMTMVQAGRNNMESLLAGADIAADQITQTLEAWNKPQPLSPVSHRIVTVLFTDMVGSTDLTQTRGDHAAQDVVRRHNSIVRTALAEYAGKEIKHTGDGIMASFASASNAIEAAIVIQRACAAHNDMRPELPLHLRIGLNAGEPIEEEDDLFGTTVQLSARVCAKAETDEILCTNVVRELSAGKDLTFVAKGMQELKGFKETVPVYEVLWKPSVEAAAPPPAPSTPKKEPKAKSTAPKEGKAKAPPSKQKAATDALPAKQAVKPTTER
ncbi:adenylate/guanylate cyclase domain-containing protein [Telmatospirillum siberiense]|uniref:Guanylate cyclase domain-containing protein n=1 Tax=Telmatospirillum siberiense TaxID=382514 RepID=A0A2N3Q199_9PROT|nr:adenylate/guanylate cyclase domain-containing protein [Telmatospirillum siberiense]PKU26371.1 hypothetical protein CWS72_00525 [Telmatospirillum siberiense]